MEWAACANVTAQSSLSEKAGTSQDDSSKIGEGSEAGGGLIIVVFEGFFSFLRFSLVFFLFCRVILAGLALRC